MKSKLFRYHSLYKGKGIESLEKILSQPKDTRDILANWINENVNLIYYNYEAPHIVEIVNDLCSGCNISVKDFSEFISLLTDTFERIYDLDDNIEDVVDDFVAQQLIPMDRKDIYLSFLKQIEKKCIELARKEKDTRYENKGLPVLTSLDYCVDLRLVPKVPYKLTDKPIEEYQPQKDNLVLTSIIEILTTDGPNKKATSFQMNFNELERFIVRLQACQKEMRLMQSYIDNFDNKPTVHQ